MDQVEVYHTTEHYLRRVLAGNVENVRLRLSVALERLDYDFIDEGEFEIQAKRSGRGWAASYASADVLDYPRTLIVKLKPLSDHSTRASFAYIVKHPSLNRGEKEVLTREAETIAALATIRAADLICAACGTEAMDDSRFCRRCGAPMTGDETALEVLRMTAETRAGHTSVVAGTILTAITMATTLTAVLILAGTGAAVAKGVFIFLIISLILSVLNLLSAGFGWHRINNALRADGKEQKVVSGRRTGRTLPEARVPALPPQNAAMSVTENTTELLDPAEKVPAYLSDDDEDGAVN